MFKFRGTRIKELEEELSDLKKLHDKNVVIMQKWSIEIDDRLKELELKIDSN